MFEKIREMSLSELAELFEEAPRLWCPLEPDEVPWCRLRRCRPCIERWLREEDKC